MKSKQNNFCGPSGRHRNWKTGSGYFERMRPSDNLFGAMYYLQTTFRNNEKTVLVERDIL